ncbi:MAG TPA: hypothetical protein VG206_05110 [Terriglobia bacterium]|nr:hypothetical protein [Terriglobia bacterium]
MLPLLFAFEPALDLIDFYQPVTDLSLPMADPARIGTMLGAFFRDFEAMVSDPALDTGKLLGAASCFFPLLLYLQPLP